MKRYSKFIDTAPYWQVFVLASILLALFSFGFMYLITTPNAMPMNIMVKISLSMGTLCGILFTLMTSQMRGSQRFWKSADEFEKKIRDANNNNDLLDLSPDFEELKKLASGTPHYHEVKRLHSMVDIKFKTLNEK